MAIKRRPWRATGMVGLLLLAFSGAGCQFLQNEFVTLDAARPAVDVEQPHVVD